ncbi:MAG: nicotinate phosphoribosyltransferase [Patescibacteria group bacterium]|nr:nicotinate phosphoribosyltransferase [Patescibacteria group bacterium]
MNRNSWEYDEQKTRPGDPLIADQYHFRQARTIFAKGDQERFTVHDYFIRKTPFGSYLLVAGIERVLKHLYNYRFTEEDIEAVKIIDPLSALPEYEEYLEYLRKLRFKGNIWAIREGDLAFPNEPIIRVEGNWLETWIIESAILKAMNYASLIATYASQTMEVAQGKPVADFGLRRSPGDGAGIVSTRSAFIGGMINTSNVRAAINLGIPVSGTMSHEFVQAYSLIAGSEVSAFIIFGRHNPDNRIYLVDTYDTIQGAKNAMRASEIIGEPANALRIDSGNLAELAIMVRELDRAKKKFTGIILTSDLDIQLLGQIVNAGTPATGFGVGTKMTAPENPPALGGVYKLSALEVDGEIIPTIKISGDEIKTTLPGEKTVWRKTDSGQISGDIITLASEGKPDGKYEPVLVQMMKGGKTRRSKMLVEPQSLQDIQVFARKNVATLPLEYRKADNPALYPVRISNNLKNLRRRTISEIRAKQAQIDEIVSN